MRSRWQRHGRTPGALLALGLGLSLLPVSVPAHRLDECLQAARIALSTNHVRIELDLTPGSAIASRILGKLDLDRDAILSPAEGEAYADSLKADLSLQIDGGNPIPLTVFVNELPTCEEIRAGVGMIRMELKAVLPHLRPGPHQLFLKNRHQPDVSVYLANALMPESERVEITRQHRDVSQREFLLEFTVR